MAFDKVDNSYSISKLFGIEFSNVTLAFVTNYLNGSIQFISQNGYISKSISLSLGAPQKSNVRSIWFLLYVNDLFDEIDCDEW